MTFTRGSYLLLTWLLMACQPTEKPGSAASPGYLIVGPAAKRTFRLSGGDTLQELLRVPEVFRTASSKVTEELKSFRFQDECTRYFADKRNVVVLLFVECHDPRSLEDGVGIAAFDSTGRILAAPVSQPSGGYFLGYTRRPGAQ